MPTIAESIVSIARANGATGDAQTITEALDLLADTLAGSDQPSQQTISQAVGVLAPYISGGGGGASVGPLTRIVQYSGDFRDEPSVGDSVGDVGYFVYKTSVGSDDLAVGTGDVNGFAVSSVAAATTITSVWGPAYHNSELDGISSYVVTLGADQYGYPIIETVEPWDGDFTTEWSVFDGEARQPSTADDPYSEKRYVFTVPSLGEGEALMLKYSFYYD